MSEIEDLYNELIYDHYRSPKNRLEMKDATSTARGDNPLCGDRVTLFVKLEDDVIEDISFLGEGCAISTASASLLTESVRGKRRAEAEVLFARFHKMVTGEDNGGSGDMGKLEAFSGVKDFPVRVKCATLAWHTLRAALQGRQDQVSTE